MKARAGFGGGCHWCTEAVFQAVPGVARVEQGFIAAPPPDAAFSEAVLVEFDPGTVPLAWLIAVHVATHAAQSNHAMRGKYRSAVYTEGADQAAAARAALSALRAEAPGLVTRVLPLAAFRPSPPQFRNYYRSGPERPFCRRHIVPKLELLASMMP
jgi:peptide-methionine (S)-S-oxide reductase